MEITEARLALLVFIALVARVAGRPFASLDHQNLSRSQDASTRGSKKAFFIDPHIYLMENRE